MKIEFRWEEIFERNNSSCQFVTVRAKVIGGWIVRDSLCDIHSSIASSMAFVPDPDHEWTIE